uniref:Uncharacterized protein n=1 Tax=Tanacetum cinerariifolium TaxID=118510 RepID=A0A699HJ48_TANCI|nr:hypothetical protein [Tanacetum cinerariifolium]
MGSYSLMCFTIKRSRCVAFDTPTTTKSSLPQNPPCVRNQAHSNGKGIDGFDFVDDDDLLDQPADTENYSCRTHANMYLEHLPSKGKCFEPDNNSSDYTMLLHVHILRAKEKNCPAATRGWIPPRLHYGPSVFKINMTCSCSSTLFWSFVILLSRRLSSSFRKLVGYPAKLINMNISFKREDVSGITISEVKDHATSLVLGRGSLDDVSNITFVMNSKSTISDTNEVGVNVEVTNTNVLDIGSHTPLFAVLGHTLS